jgi:hypothetical protein
MPRVGREGVSGLVEGGRRGDGRWRWRRTFVLWMTDSGTMGFIWSSRSDNMVTILRTKAQG